MSVDIIQGECRAVLAGLPAESVHTCITSPPFYALRDYKLSPSVWGGKPGCVHEWGQWDEAHDEREEVAHGKTRTTERCYGEASRRFDGNHQKHTAGAFCRLCGAWLGCLGLEPTPALYIAHLVEVFVQVHRVLHPSGTVWLNLGDSFAGSWGNQGRTAERGSQRAINGPMMQNLDAGYPAAEHNTGVVPAGFKPKDLMMLPHRVAIALQESGWWVRSTIVWSKPNPMPESVTDRPTQSHEYVFMLAKNEHYFYDQDAIREPHHGYRKAGPNALRGQVELRPRGNLQSVTEQSYHANGRNKRSVWSVATQPYEQAHFACVDAETECLTLTGWKRYAALRPGELLAAYDLGSGQLRYEPLLDVAVYPYNGHLYQLGGRDLGVVCTPNHRCIVKTRSGVVSVRRADELVGGLSVPCAASWVAGVSEGSGDPGVGVGELLGWALTEGHWNDTSVAIHQSVSANAVKVDRIRALLDRAGFHYKEYTRTREPHLLPNGKMMAQSSVEACFSVSGHGYRVLRELCGAERPAIPWRATLWSEASIAALLEGIRLGDGHTRSDGRFAVVQHDKHFVDMVQVLALRLGWRCIVSARHPSDRATCWTAFVTKHPWHALRGTNGLRAAIATVPYSGTVWCPSLPSGTWVARRRGRVWITGNTFPEALITPMVLAGTSEAGCCSVCRAPYRRVVERADVAKDRPTGQPWAAGIATQDNWASGTPTHSGLSNDHYRVAHTAGWKAGCSCEAGPPIGCTVMDIFCGSGTTGVVARRYGRNFIGIELNESYCKLSEKRIASVCEPLFTAATLGGSSAGVAR